MICPLSIVALAAAEPIPQEAYRRASTLTLMLAILGVVVVTTLLMVVVVRRSRRRRDAMPKPAPTEHVDAWAESGRRFDTSITEIDPDDD
jgi:heme/copper-type cytochrome/quinol oxidase subunit 2